MKKYGFRLDLFIRRGYAATKITDIAKQVGMSTGLLYGESVTPDKTGHEACDDGQVNYPRYTSKPYASNIPLSFCKHSGEGA